MRRIAAKKLRDQMSDALNRVAYGGERIIIERRGKGAAVLVSLEDAKLLERLEDRIDVEFARKALKEGGKPIPWEAVKKKLHIGAKRLGRTRRAADRREQSSRGQRRAD